MVATATVLDGRADVPPPPAGGQTQAPAIRRVVDAHAAAWRAAATAAAARHRPVAMVRRRVFGAGRPRSAVGAVALTPTHRCRCRRRCCRCRHKATVHALPVALGHDQRYHCTLCGSRRRCFFGGGVADRTTRLLAGQQPWPAALWAVPAPVGPGTPRGHDHGRLIPKRNGRCRRSGACQLRRNPAGRTTPPPCGLDGRWSSSACRRCCLSPRCDGKGFRAWCFILDVRHFQFAVPALAV